MPFTFSHPAIVLPVTFLNKKYYSLTGLIVGSITPDFEYFLRMKIYSKNSHSISGLFWFDLPLGILLAFLFHNVIRNSLYDNLPSYFGSRLQQFKTFNWTNYFFAHWPIIIISILLGAASHLFWDSFTHRNGYFVSQIPFLRMKVEFFGVQTRMSEVLQHTSSILGGLTILYALSRLPVTFYAISKYYGSYWTIVSLISLAIMELRFSNGLHLKFYGNIVVSGISALIIALAITPTLLGLFTTMVRPKRELS